MNLMNFIRSALDKRAVAGIDFIWKGYLVIFFTRLNAGSHGNHGIAQKKFMLFSVNFSDFREKYIESFQSFVP
jgi:hypothetical protein